MKILFISLGCDKNLVDSERDAGASGTGALYHDGRARQRRIVIVVNTCCFIG